MKTPHRPQDAVMVGRLRKRSYRVAPNQLEFVDIEVEFEPSSRHSVLKGFVLGVSASLVAAAIWSVIEFWL